MISLLLAATLSFSQADAKFAFDTANEFVTKCTPRDAGTVRGRIAANFILDSASAAGADVCLDRFEVKTPDGKKILTNLEAEFCVDPAKPWIVLLSHYDTKIGVKSQGANDGASTTALLIAMARMFCDSRALNGNVLIVWTDGEECINYYSKDDGLWGSRHAAKKLKDSGKEVRAVICVDMLGDKNLEISIPENTSPALKKIALYAAKKAGISGKVKCIPELVTDDHVPFIELDYKSIVLIDFEYGSAKGLNDYWHTPNDTIDKISANSLLESGKILTEMLNVLLK